MASSKRRRTRNMLALLTRTIRIASEGDMTPFPAAPTPLYEKPGYLDTNLLRLLP